MVKSKDSAIDARIKNDTAELATVARRLLVSLLDIRNLEFEDVVDVRTGVRLAEDYLRDCARELDDREQVLNRQSAGGLMNKKRKNK